MIPCTLCSGRHAKIRAHLGCRADAKSVHTWVVVPTQNPCTLGLSCRHKMRAHLGCRADAKSVHTLASGIEAKSGLTLREGVAEDACRLSRMRAWSRVDSMLCKSERTEGLRARPSREDAFVSRSFLGILELTPLSSLQAVILYVWPKSAAVFLCLSNSFLHSSYIFLALGSCIRDRPSHFPTFGTTVFVFLLPRFTPVSDFSLCHCKRDRRMRSSSVQKVRVN
jgi:hypothetical protein